ncbi:MAG: NADH:flavin oxidoreductase [Desulfobacteraceae bacterium]|nr:NADH:flavin oxidoreductase [Desulfobacteraceae bacterium]MBC2756799.1 NADH:flavin oxidoreductase [Desulfobacteraceae bacterium]
MSVLFESTEINGMKLANRFVRSATWEGMAADDGGVTPKLIQTMVDLAEGGVGLIISGHAYISPEGQAGPWQLGIYKDELIDGLKTMTDAVHEAGGKIIAQLAHAGHFAIKALTKQPPNVVSNFEGLSKSPRHELTKEDIQKLVNAFSQAAQRAKSAGFDGVQIHSAHGYLLSQFLSPAYNRRQDEYGGSIENRARVHLEVYNAIRNAVGKNYPVLIKINSEDHIENGLSLEDSISASKMLAHAGINAIELSGGTLSSGKLSPSRGGINKEEKEAYFKESAAAYKKEMTVSLILVGGLRSLNVAEQTIKNKTADYISMCRPFIREPGLINRWLSGDTSPAKCKSDNLCFGPALEGKGIYCVVDELEKTKQS